jgi:ATP synthase protein I
LDDPGRADAEASFEARLSAARARLGPRRGRASQDGAEADRQAGGPWGSGLRAGLEVASALAVGVGLGLAADWWAGTRPWFLVVGLFLGGAAGVLNVYRLMLGRHGLTGRSIRPAPPGGGAGGGAEDSRGA